MTRPAGSSAAGTPAAGDRAEPRYVYGVVAAAAAEGWPQPQGLGDPPGKVRALVEGSLAALVSPLAPEFTPGRRADLETHERVLGEAVARTTVVPMRFGVVMDGDEGVRDTLLRRHADELQELLRRLDGHVQMTLKAFYAEDVLIREVVAEQPEIARAEARLRGRSEAETRPARIAIGEMVAAGVARRREADERALLARVRPSVTDVAVEEPANERIALHAQLLVHRDRRQALDDVVRELAAEQADRLALRYVGPIAPYSFADLALEA
jgi:hypothetical protein